MSKTDNHNKMYINKDGNRVVRVTEVIKVLAKDQLMTWANMLGFKHIDYKKELERTANIGTMFHGVLEQMHTEKELPIIDFEAYGIYDYESQLEATHALKSYFKWYDNIKSKYHVKFTEKVVVGQKLGGTIDCGIDGFEDKDKVIFVDYKTASGFYLTQFLQLAGYVKIYEELYGKNTVEGIMVVCADKKHGNPAQARLIKRDKLDVFITCFDCLFNVAYSTKILNSTWREMAEVIM